MFLPLWEHFSVKNPDILIYMNEIATFAGGCFWCFEALFKRLRGVSSVVSGYCGGNKEDANYDRVSMGTTNHAEAVQVTFDPNILSYDKLLEVFWRLHDPTTVNRQGNDTGSQYRSMIFYHSSEQKELAERSKKEAQKLYKDSIVTEIVPFKNFYKAEGYHQSYYEKNQDAPYCRYIIDPKIKKLFSEFGNNVDEKYKDSSSF